MATSFARHIQRHSARRCSLVLREPAERTILRHSRTIPDHSADEHRLSQTLTSSSVFMRKRRSQIQHHMSQETNRFRRRNAQHPKAGVTGYIPSGARRRMPVITMTRVRLAHRLRTSRRTASPSPRAARLHPDLAGTNASIRTAPLLALLYSDPSLSPASAVSSPSRAQEAQVLSWTFTSKSPALPGYHGALDGWPRGVT